MNDSHPETLPPVWGKRKLGDLELPFTRYSGLELLEQRIFRAGNARAARSGGASRHPRSVIDILRDQFRFDFRKELDRWVKARWEEVRVSEDDPEGRYGISDCHVRDTMIPFDRDTDRWLVVLLFECTLMYTRPDLPTPRSQTKDMVMGFLLDLPGKKCLGYDICGIFSEDSVLPKGDELMADEYFLPILPREKYADFAKWLLYRYYPIEYDVCPPPEFIPEAMAERMDFKIYERFFGGDLSETEALVCFRKGIIPVLSEEDYSEEPEPVTRGDIYLNIPLTADPVRRKNALTHELVHALVHEPYALLQNLALSDADPFGQMGYGDWQSSAASDSPDPVIRRMEQQAERLTAHLRMPVEETRMRAEWRFSLYPDRYAPETVAAVIRHLAEHFGTSLTQTRIHLSENGWPEAGGIGLYDPVAGQSVPDHGCADGKWPEGQTYTVPYGAVFALARRDEAFRKIFHSGKYTFAENHFCLDTPKYIRRSRGVIALTDYARRHMSECCLPFAVSGRNPYAMARDFLARKKKIPVTDKYVRFAPLGATAEERKFHFEEKKRWEELKSGLTGDFGSSVRKIMEVKNISLEEMAERLFRSKQAISQTLNHKLPTFENAFSLVVELGCPYEISVFLLGKLKYDVESGNDDLYRDILKSPGMSYRLMNEVLAECGRPRM